jgi:hypothetical protein
MTDVGLTVGDRQVITARLEPNSVQGRDMAGLPMLYFPLQLQLLHGGQNRDVEYTVMRLAGTLQNQSLNEFASFEVSPLALVPNATPYFRQQDVSVAFDRLRIRRFEDARAGGDARFQVVLSCLVWYPAQQKFEIARGSGNLEVIVPKSHWAERVISTWNLSNIHVVEIVFPKSTTGENFRTSYARIEEAEKLFVNGQYKDTLTALRRSFETLAKSLGHEKAGKEFFESLFAASAAEKKEKARDAVNGIYRFLHLGPHEQVNQTEPSLQPVISRQDARFALTLAYAIFEYITPSA